MDHCGRTRRRLILVGSVFLTLAFGEDADARRGGRGRGLSSGARPQGPVLSQQELEWCVQNERLIDRGQAALDARDRQMSEMSARIEMAGAELDQRASRLDRRSQTEVNRYNGGVRAHQQSIASFNEEIRVRNAQMDTLNFQVSDYNARCSGKNYYESDLRAVMSRLGN